MCIRDSRLTSRVGCELLSNTIIKIKSSKCLISNHQIMRYNHIFIDLRYLGEQFSISDIISTHKCMDKIAIISTYQCAIPVMLTLLPHASRPNGVTTAD